MKKSLTLFDIIQKLELIFLRKSFEIKFLKCIKYCFADRFVFIFQTFFHSDVFAFQKNDKVLFQWNFKQIQSSKMIEILLNLEKKFERI